VSDTFSNGSASDWLSQLMDGEPGWISSLLGGLTGGGGETAGEGMSMIGGLFQYHRGGYVQTEFPHFTMVELLMMKLWLN
jgi:hypothetical protein